jgi:hypothetical protein
VLGHNGGPAKAQLLYWVENGDLRSLCVEAGAEDVVQLPPQTPYIRGLAVTTAGLNIVTAAGPFSTPLTIHHGASYGRDLTPVAISLQGGIPLTSSSVMTSLDPETWAWWESGRFDYRIESLQIDGRSNLPVTLRPLEYEFPPGSGVQGPTTTVDLFADGSALYRLFHDQVQSWLQVTSFDNSTPTTVHPLAEPTWQIAVDDNELYVVDGDPAAPTVAVYTDFMGETPERSLLLSSDAFGEYGRIVDLAIELPFGLGSNDLYVLHEGLISRLPRDGSPAEMVLELDPAGAGTRHSLQALYLRLESCERIFGDDDGDGVANWYDHCNQTPLGTAVDLVGRPLGDITENCIVDLKDFSVLQNGMTE